MNPEGVILQLGIVMIGAALLGTLFLWLRQPIILAYIAVGVILGPYGLALLPEHHQIEQSAQVGVMLLLFILGLNLQPAKLVHLFRRVALITLSTSLLFCLLVTLALAYWLGWTEALLCGIALMLSSTVIALKLIPTTTLHHRHTGELMTSVLLLQDVLAIIAILYVTHPSTHGLLPTLAQITISFAVLIGLATLFVQRIVLPLLRRFDVVQEYAFVVALAWCLLLAGLTHSVGISYEIGAFAAGLALASSRIAVAIAEHLKPLREFFLILFFFAIGAQFNIMMPWPILLAGIVLGIALIVVKALIYRLVFSYNEENSVVSKELSIRLAQASEFSILLAYAAQQHDRLSTTAMLLIQTATLVTFVFSTLWVVRSLRTPISSPDH